MNSILLQTMNPLELHGQDSIAFVFVLMILCNGISWVVRHSILGKNPSHVSSRPLTPYEIAFLSGGKSRVSLAAIMSLVHQKKVTLKKREKELEITDPTADSTDPLEQAILNRVRLKSRDLKDIHNAMEPELYRIRTRLENDGFLHEDAYRQNAVAVAWMIAMIPVVYCIVKTWKGASEGFPVGFLFLELLMSIFFACTHFFTVIPKTPAGSEALEKAKSLTAQQGYSSSVSSQSDPMTFVTSVALIGPAALAGTIYSDYPMHMQPKRESSDYSSSSCGTSGCSSGDSGGSSGDGGGGCGGGGCGGCGG